MHSSWLTSNQCHAQMTLHPQLTITWLQPPSQSVGPSFSMMRAQRWRRGRVQLPLSYRECGEGFVSGSTHVLFSLHYSFHTMHTLLHNFLWAQGKYFQFSEFHVAYLPSHFFFIFMTFTRLLLISSSTCWSFSMKPFSFSPCVCISCLSPHLFIFHESALLIA